MPFPSPWSGNAILPPAPNASAGLKLQLTHTRVSRGFKSQLTGIPVPGAQRMNMHFQNMGWRSKVSKKRSTFSISINKLVATGCGLEKGNSLFCYLAEDKDKRPVMIVYLDGKEKCKGAVAKSGMANS